MPIAAFLSDLQWSLLRPLFPSSSRGRPSFDNRLILDLVFHKLTSHLPWYDLPSTSPSWQACYQHYHHWQHTGLWKSIIKVLLTDLYRRGGLDLLTTIESKEISIQKDCHGHLDVTFPDYLEDTWQLSTAQLLIHLLFSGL